MKRKKSVGGEAGASGDPAPEKTATKQPAAPSDAPGSGADPSPKAAPAAGGSTRKEKRKAPSGSAGQPAEEAKPSKDVSSTTAGRAEPPQNDAPAAGGSTRKKKRKAPGGSAGQPAEEAKPSKDGSSTTAGRAEPPPNDAPAAGGSTRKKYRKAGQPAEEATAGDSTGKKRKTPDSPAAAGQSAEGAKPSKVTPTAGDSAGKRRKNKRGSASDSAAADQPTGKPRKPAATPAPADAQSKKNERATAGGDDGWANAWETFCSGRSSAAKAGETTPAAHRDRGGNRGAEAPPAKKQRTQSSSKDAVRPGAQQKKAARAKGSIPWHPFETDYGDHFETSRDAIQDIAPVMRVLEKAMQVKLRVYDPYYCAGAVKEDWRRAGFQCENENVDCYAAWESHSEPTHNVIVTNPPFSGQHKEWCLEYCVSRRIPWLVLLPAYCTTKQYFAKFLKNQQPIFLVPRSSYTFTHPEGTGYDASPFYSMWMGCFGEHHSAVVSAFSGPRQMPNLRVSESVEDLKANNDVSSAKRPNPRLRKKMKQRLAGT
eukprot:gene2328-3608_t